MMYSIRRLTLLVSIFLTAFSTVKSQIYIPDLKQIEQQTAAQYEATGPGVILRNDKGESAIFRNVWGLSSIGNYLCIRITENRINRVYRIKHNGQGFQVPNYVRGGGCIVEVHNDYVDLTTPNGYYRFTQATAFPGAQVPMPNTPSYNGNSSGSSSQPKSYIICHACKGTGKCGACNGKGYYRNMYGGGVIACKICSEADGRICTVCNGTGRW